MKRLSKVLLSAGLILGLASCGDVVLESTNNVTTKPTEVKPTQKAEPTQSETPKSEAYKRLSDFQLKLRQICQFRDTYQMLIMIILNMWELMHTKLLIHQKS